MNLSFAVWLICTLSFVVLADLNYMIPAGRLGAIILSQAFAWLILLACRKLKVRRVGMNTPNSGREQ